MDSIKILGKNAGEDFEALAKQKGITVEELQLEAIRWYLKKAQNKLRDDKPKPRLKRLQQLDEK